MFISLNHYKFMVWDSNLRPKRRLLFFLSLKTFSLPFHSQRDFLRIRSTVTQSCALSASNLVVEGMQPGLQRLHQPIIHWHYSITNRHRAYPLHQTPTRTLYPWKPFVSCRLLLASRFSMVHSSSISSKQQAVSRTASFPSRASLFMGPAQEVYWLCTTHLPRVT